MYGVIDIGSNTIRLSFYQMEKGEIIHVMNKKEVVGLASYISKDKSLSDKGIKTLIDVLKNFARTLSHVAVKDMFVFATASLRNVSNSKEILKKIRETSGFAVEVLTGEEEAKYGYMGVSHVNSMEKGYVVDIGGGSTEVVIFDMGEIKDSFSIPIGSLNMYGKHVYDILPSRREIENIQKEMDFFLSSHGIKEKYEPSLYVCGTGGSIRHIGKLCNQVYGIGKSYNYVKRDQLRQLIELSVNERREFLDGLIEVAPDRIHTLMPGLAILDSILKWSHSRLVCVSPCGVREGYIYHQLRERGVLNG